MALTTAETKALALATIDWRPIPPHVSTDALGRLERRGLIERRVRPTTEKGRLAVAEWRRVPRDQ